ncbi:hypothetical protein CCR80_08230 [Rhodothalassium salexigens]|uniref:hypothetical protein n=1 Tax=Rhodothalassium salexigens TaxID=1086 RepID=UPI001911492C|nr:hypothetical protein [Rhodothalassium salexigens]MBK5921017.1 hypothetical protein [Rhodothalassium salexigens]
MAQPQSPNDHRPRAVLHVGMAKCASTYLQHQAQEAATAGRIAASVWYPWDTLINQAAEAVGIPVTAFPAARNPQQDWPADLPLMATNECLTGTFPEPLRLTGSRHFTGTHMARLQDQVARQLKAVAERHLAAYDVRVLLITRAPEDWLCSVYKNMVLMGVPDTPDAFLGHFADVFTEWLDIDRLIGLYEALFSPAAVTVLPFEMLRDRPADFAGRINELVGATVVEDRPARNVGLDDAATERVRAAWSVLDELVPPAPDWSDPAVQYKRSTWRFLHQSVLNVPQRVARANARLSGDTAAYTMPADLVDAMKARMTRLADHPAFTPYRERYATP